LRRARNAVTVTDPDAGGFVHWLVWGIRAGTSNLPGAVSPTAFPGGRNGFGEMGFSGPCPPKGTTHTYWFTLYQLPATLHLPPDATVQQLVRSALETGGTAPDLHRDVRALSGSPGPAGRHGGPSGDMMPDPRAPTARRPAAGTRPPALAKSGMPRTVLALAAATLLAGAGDAAARYPGFSAPPGAPSTSGGHRVAGHT
jgi:hypothetical protein